MVHISELPAAWSCTLKIFKADPGEAAAMIQVIMDIAGVVLTCSLGALILEAF